MEHLALTCGRCGPVRVTIGSVEVHHNRRDGFRLLAATCPSCDEVVLSADPATLDRALHGGARRCELLPPAPPLTLDDLEDLHAALADGDWCARLCGDGHPRGEPSSGDGEVGLG